MAEFVLTESKDDFVLVPDGEILSAEVLNCEVRDTPFEDEKNPGKMQEEVSFTFLVTDGEFQNRKIFGRTPTTFNTNENCKLRLWVQELLAIDLLPENFRFNTDTLIGLPCRIAVAVRNSKPSPKYPKGRTTNYVWDVLRQNSNAAFADEVF